MSRPSTGDRHADEERADADQAAIPPPHGPDAEAGEVHSAHRRRRVRIEVEDPVSTAAAAAAAADQEPAMAARAPASEELEALLGYMQCNGMQAAPTGPMLRAVGKLGRLRTHFLFDTGANASFLSQAFCKRHGLRVTPSVQAVTLANGVEASGLGRVEANVSLGSYQAKVDLNVFPLSGADVVLGSDWMAAVNAEISYLEGSITIDCPKGGRAKLVAGEDNSADYVLSTLQLLQLQKADELAELYVVQVKPTSEDAGGDLAGGPATQARLDALVDEFKEVWSEPPPGVNRKLGIEHEIPMEPGHKPPCRPAYRLSAEEEAALERMLTDHLAKGWIRPSSSPYGSPVIFVRKRDGTLRMVHDYRAVNALSRFSAWPLPRIETLLEKLHGATVFSKLDLQNGFLQVPMKESDIPKTAFRTPLGLFEYLVMPMGLSGSPSTFAAMMSKI